MKEGYKMIKVYMIFINCGFGGVKYFHDEQNAINYAKSINEHVIETSFTSKEYFNSVFEDASPLIEEPNVQFTALTI
jgi:hypothetical protein